ncbi:MAG: AmmeMemoRadiSam system protein B [Anaerolineales bacterium]|nr:MAG: AmmeMemoRadiSam system protein B [Anaerolineales bacterium]
MMTDDDHPRIRNLNAIPASQGNRQLVLLEDPLGIAEQTILIPPQLTPLLMLCDGTRSIPEIQSAYISMYGLAIDVEEINRWLAIFNEAALLDNAVFHSKKRQAVEAYRTADARPMSFAGEIYPSQVAQLSQTLNAYLEQAGKPTQEANITGIICPHIDYERGKRVYAEVMSQSRQAILDAELIVVLGTDHFDDGNPLTLTQQSYQTPLGVKPTAISLTQSMDQKLTGLDVFRGELRHQHEHSIELALVWLHHMRESSPCPVLPILCGAHPYLFEEGTGREQAWVQILIDHLGDTLKDQRTLIVAAADLAHVGAVFGGPGLPPEQRSEIVLEDEKLLQRVKEVDPRAFIDQIIRVQDRNNVCGTTPIYLLLRLLAPATGTIVGYELCPADHEGNSWVSICGAIFS